MNTTKTIVKTLPELPENSRWIPTANIDALTARMAKINRKADKLGMDHVGMSETGRVTLHRQWTDELGDRAESFTPFASFEFTGFTPRIAGWSMIAVIELGENCNILRTVPGFTGIIPERFRSIGTVCDHCHTNRVRNETFVIHNEETGDYRAIGRNCLADFMPTSSMADVALFFASVADLDAMIGECGFEQSEGGNDNGTRELRKVISMALYISREFGYVSATKAKESFTPITSTSAHVQSLLSNCKKTTGERAILTAWDAKNNTPEWTAEVDAIIAHFANLTDFDNDYLYNLYALTQNELVTRRQFGYAVSMPSSYDRAMGIKAERAKKTNEYFGSKGDKLELTVTVIGCRNIESRYGSSTLYTMEDAEGRSFKTFSTSNTFDDVRTGDTITLKGTVKGHSEWKDRKSTELTRCKVTATVKAGINSAMSGELETEEQTA